MGEANRRINGVQHAPLKIEQPPVDDRYVEVAQRADESLTMVLEGIADTAPADCGAVAAGAIMALVRFVIHRIVAPLGVPNVRAVFSVILPAANKAAEQIVAQLDQSRPVGQSKEDGASS